MVSHTSGISAMLYRQRRRSVGEGLIEHLPKLAVSSVQASFHPAIPSSHHPVGLIPSISMIRRSRRSGSV